MSLTKSIFCTGCVAALIGTIALPNTAKAGEWEGAYGGIILGYGSGDISGIGQIVGVDETDKMKGLTYGVLAGWNKKNESTLFGFEGDLSLSDIDGDIDVLTVNVQEKVQWNVNLRARAGTLISEQTLLYAAGGLAMAKYKINTDSLTAGNDKATFLGWTLGVGMETQLLENAKGRIEYLYTDYGTKEMFDSVSGVDVSADQNIVRAGILFEFGA